MDISQFFQEFFVEASELLVDMEQLLLDLNVQAPDSEQLNAIFRAAHSIKGGAATFGFTALTDTTHLLETLLDRARHGQLSLNGPMIDVFLETKDAMQEQMNAYQADKEPEPEMVAHICAVLQQLALENDDGKTASLPPVLAAAPSAAATAADETLRVRFVRLSDSECGLLTDELGNLGKVLSRTRSNDQLTVILETSCDPDDIIAVCCFLIDDSQIDITREPAGPDSAWAADESSGPAGAEILSLYFHEGAHDVLMSVIAPAEPHEFDARLIVKTEGREEALPFRMVEPASHPR